MRKISAKQCKTGSDADCLVAGDDLRLTELARFTKTLNFAGSVLTPTTGNSRWYPHRPITLTACHLNMGTTSSYPTQVKVKKNGVSILTVTMPVGQHKVVADNLELAVDDADYLTCDITQASGGKDLTITLIYRT